ncbi:unknown protein [Microcystis aeruginosa NIES-843]|uniref:Uncharacterized protein n=1 Tax=Microcystis aeruginosa (strain NIES-843 / IAM M-2473) TaxID=449447 RepID=B0JH53_MICAN|nr:unknown protein [Microcystis aeruginosa NIES-843]
MPAKISKISKTLLIAPSGKIYIIKAKPLAFIFFNNNYRSKTIYLPPEKFLINRTRSRIIRESIFAGEIELYFV